MEKNLLYFLLGNVDMGRVSTQALIEISKDQAYKKQLLADLSEYESFFNKCQTLKLGDEEAQPISSLAKISTKMSIQFKTLQDKSPAKLSNLLMEGFDMGISDMQENIDKAVSLKERDEVIALAREYLEFLEKSRDSYKKFL